MKRLLQILVPALLVVAPAAALASAGSSKQVWVTTCTTAQYKPAVIVLACADVSTYLTKLKWTRWTESRATGTGTEKANDCNPSCINGHFHSYPVAVVLSKATSCHKQKHKVFDDLKLTFTGKRPAQTPKTLKLTLDCPY
jgi:hypothetical protein